MEHYAHGSGPGPSASALFKFAGAAKATHVVPLRAFPTPCPVLTDNAYPATPPVLLRSCGTGRAYRATP
eukprot:2098783-Rhodomonas_salina.1